jgi:hypothetical protein
MNWKKLFYTPPSEMTPAKVKMQAVAFLALGVFYMLLFLYYCINSYYRDSGMLLKVNAYNVPQKLYKSVDFDFGHYVTGVEGTLYYKPSSIVDFFVLETIGGRSNVIDFLFILVCSILIYNSISTITERNPFSKGRVKTFLIIAFVTLGTGLVKSYFALFVARTFALQNKQYV